MTDKVCQLLADHSLQVGNIPVGMYQYNIDQEPFPKVRSKYVVSPSYSTCLMSE